MIDISKQKWNFSKEEKFAIKWFNEHGYNGELKKQYLSKTVFVIEKDGVVGEFSLPQGIKIDIAKYMDSYEKNWNMLCELQRLRNEAKEKQLI